MTADSSIAIATGPYAGAVHPEAYAPAFIHLLADLPGLVEAHGTSIYAWGGAEVFRATLPVGDGSGAFICKRFSPQPAWKDRLDRRRGSAARRSFETAMALCARGVPTPRPLVWLDHWEGPHLRESWYLSEDLRPARSLRDRLLDIYRRTFSCAELIALLDAVAAALRHMHDQGVRHGDLGNQNILLRETDAPGPRDVFVIDLNRVRCGPPLSVLHRALDVSRIHLPSEFRRVFHEMYWQHRPPRAFKRWEALCRATFDLHTLTRPLRHPLREARRRREQDPAIVYPSPKDLWIWDEKSGQAISTLVSRDRYRHMPVGSHLRAARGVVRGTVPVWRAYREIRQGLFGAPVEMQGRVGVALHPRPGTADREFDLAQQLGPIPILLRYYHHEGMPEWTFTHAFARRLVAAGHPVAVALVQDRQSVTDPAAWKGFAQAVCEEASQWADWIEVGHAVNRVKWGLWSLADYERLAAPAMALRERFPSLRLMGPASIDFEYHYLMGLLFTLPPSCRFDALSHHLYVDRRGAPEGRQGPFSTVEKCALAKAIARASPHCEDRVVISEANWPLEGTGIHSPIGSPYLYPGQQIGGPSVSEDDYAAYLVRYLALAVCSGTVDRVYWWRLVARGYGLVDDTDPVRWRARPAFRALRTWLQTVGNARFERREERPDGVQLFHFRKEDGRAVRMVYALQPGPRLPVEPARAVALDLQGQALDLGQAHVALGPAPVFVIEPTPDGGPPSEHP